MGVEFARKWKAAYDDPSDENVGKLWSIGAQHVAELGGLLDFKSGSTGSVTGPSEVGEVTEGAVQPKLHRPKYRTEFLEKFKTAAKKAKNGRWIDANTGKSFPGKYAVGHTYGNENWRLFNYAEDLGLTQEELNDLVNEHPEWFQVEKPENNASHKFEMPKKEP
jgi:hypothetical protein